MKRILYPLFAFVSFLTASEFFWHPVVGPFVIDLLTQSREELISENIKNMNSEIRDLYKRRVTIEEIHENIHEIEGDRVTVEGYWAHSTEGPSFRSDRDERGHSNSLWITNISSCIFKTTNGNLITTIGYPQEVLAIGVIRTGDIKNSAYGYIMPDKTYLELISVVALEGGGRYQ